MTAAEKKVIFALVAGHGVRSGTTSISTARWPPSLRSSFRGLEPGAAFIASLMAFAGSSCPFGALVFGRLGDMIAQYTFRSLS